MSDRDSLKAAFPVRILPRDVQNIGMGFARDHLEPLQQIAFTGGRLAVNPRPMGHDRFFSGEDSFDRVKTNMGLRRTTAGSHFILEKDGQDLDALDRAIGCIGQLKEKIGVGLDESIRKRLFFIAHLFCLLSGLRLAPFFFLLFDKISMSPG